jgi:hypothetical protein
LGAVATITARKGGSSRASGEGAELGDGLMLSLVAGEGVWQRWSRSEQRMPRPRLTSDVGRD